MQLLGRVTYEEFSAVWPGMKGEAGEFGVKMNEMPKVVVSSTLTDPEWENTSVISGDDLPAEVGKLKAQYDGDILVAGSARLANALREQDLVDEYRLMVHPVVLGGGSGCSRAVRRPTWSWSSHARPGRTCCCSRSARPALRRRSTDQVTPGPAGGPVPAAWSAQFSAARRSAHSRRAA